MALNWHQIATLDLLKEKYVITVKALRRLV